MNANGFALAFGAALFLWSVPVAAQSSEAVPTAEENAAADPASPDYVRCKRIDVTGSRARKERVCKTNAEWDRAARVGSELGRDTVDRSTSIYRAEGM